MQSLVALEQVTAVGVAMQSDGRSAGPLEGANHAVHRLASRTFPARGQGRVHHLQCEQRVDGLQAE